MALLINGVRVAGVGSKGKDGAGVVAGGTTDQILTKKTDADYDTEWVSLPSTDPTLSIEGVAADAKAVGAALDSMGERYLTGATVGQIARIASVDENGVPTAWEAVDMPSNILPMPTTAAIGQFIVVSAVDENGMVIATEAVTMPTTDDELT